MSKAFGIIKKLMTQLNLIQIIMEKYKVKKYNYSLKVQLNQRTL